MKRYNSRNSMDEREKFRKFRELDDAFADALRALDKASPQETTPGEELAEELAETRTKASDAELAEKLADELADAEASRHKLFEQRLLDLMKEYRQSAGNVSELLETMLTLGRIA